MGPDMLGGSLRGKTVIVVEDHEDTRDMMTALLTVHGLQVMAACNGPEALSLADGRVPDVILCDLRMPGMDGFALLRELRADPRLARVPVLAISGLSSPDEQILIDEAGFAGHLVKPVELSAVRAALERLFDGEQGSVSRERAEEKSRLRPQRDTILPQEN